MNINNVCQFCLKSGKLGSTKILIKGLTEESSKRQQISVTRSSLNGGFLTKRTYLFVQRRVS